MSTTIDSHQAAALALHMQALTEAVRALSERAIAGEIHGRSTAEGLKAVSLQLEALRTDLAPILHEHKLLEAKRHARADLALEQEQRDKVWHEALGPMRALLSSPWAVAVVTGILTAIAGMVLGRDFMQHNPPTVIEANAGSSLYAGRRGGAQASYAGD
jgi:hypothetical protein